MSDSDLIERLAADRRAAPCADRAGRVRRRPGRAARALFRARPGVGAARRHGRGLAVVAACAAVAAPITPQGGNTGLVGGQIPEGPEIVLSLKRLNRVREVDALADSMIVEAGVTLAEAQAAAEARRPAVPASPRERRLLHHRRQSLDQRRRRRRARLWQCAGADDRHRGRPKTPKPQNPKTPIHI